MTISKEYREVCRMLLDATKEGRVNWVERYGSYAVQLPDFDFEIWNGTDEDTGTRFVAVGLKDQRGRQLLDDWFIEPDSPDFEMVDELCGSARRQVNRVAEKLEHMKLLLESGAKLGSPSPPKKS